MPTIDFHTYDADTVKNFKPVLAKNIVPEWWKSIKVAELNKGQVQQTIRACPAMDDWLKSGWIITANRDIEVINGTNPEDDGETTKVAAFDPSGQDYHSRSHPTTQFADAFEYLGKGSQIKDAFKMRNAWNVKTPPGYSCFYLDPFLFQNKYFATWQGIIDTDTFNVGMDNAQIIFYPKVDHSFVIKAGTPLVQIIPFKRETWNATYTVKTHKSWTDNRGEGTTDFEKSDTTKSMQEWGQLMEEETVRNFGPYRAKGYWKPKGKMFNEESPPPECPFHQGEEDGS